MDSNSTAQPGQNQMQPGTNNQAPAGNGGQVNTTPNRPGFATTGGTSDMSHNWFYNFIYGLFN